MAAWGPEPAGASRPLPARHPLHCHQLPLPCGVRKTGELRPLLPLTFLPAWGLATSPRRLGWRPGSPAPHDPRVPLCERQRQVAGGRLRPVVLGAWPRAGGGHEWGEGPRTEQAEAFCNLVPFRPEYEVGRPPPLEDRVSAPSPRGPGPCQGCADSHLTMISEPPRRASGL